MNDIKHEDVLKIAKLARLSLSAQEVQNMQHDLASILKYVERLNTLDTQHVEAQTHAVDLPTQFREDVVQPSLPIEKSMLNAPERLGDGFGVPKIIE
jgi:aspartyl-tRNA(Asn)/glutamyl-tRNA(Gln) amidotransferase subunit C